MSWGLVIGAVVSGAGIVASQDSARRARNAVSDQQKIADKVTYEPINIDALIKKANETAVANATQSLELERQLSPGVADTRDTLQRTVAEQLKMGGNLPPDVANQVTQAARVASAGSGTLGGSSVPLTAQLLGVSALGLLNQRQNQAQTLLATNPLPQVGLDPGTVASLEAQNNAANNQFNLEKAGINSTLTQARNDAGAAGAGVTANNFSSLLGLLTSNTSGGVDSGSILGKLANAYGNKNPALDPLSAT